MCVSLTSQSSPHFFSHSNQGPAPAFSDVTQPLSAAGLQRRTRPEQGGETERREERRREKANLLKTDPLSADEQEDIVPVSNGGLEMGRLQPTHYTQDGQRQMNRTNSTTSS